jgi:endoglucanase
MRILPRAAVAVASIAVVALLEGWATAPAGRRPRADPPGDEPAARFLQVYMQPDGRVVRLDQGRDTVSEGQAYGLLLAEAAGDQAAFHRIWIWTRQHLQLGDGLFAFHVNAAGRVVSREPASDADLLIAWALLRYQGPSAAEWHRDGRRVAAAVLEHEVTTGRDPAVLTAGPWAVGWPATLNPSYWSLPAMQCLAGLTGEREWNRLAARAISLTREITDNGRLLPPDWAGLRADGAVAPERAPDGSALRTQYGPDAQRTVVWFATSPDPQARALAARWWRILRRGLRATALALSLNGAVLSAKPSPLAMVASAAAARAAGHQEQSTVLLQQAAAQQQRWPTYYGGAWAALGPILLLSGGDC